MKKKINISRVIWITGVFLLLITILLMVMDYKINYQYLTKNYLYFYNCNNSVCTSQVNDSIDKASLYSTYECGYEICPSIQKTLENNYIILTKDSTNILYNYMSNTIISNNYEQYNLINDKYIIVTLNNYQGIIDTSNNILVNTIYDEIGYFNNDILSGYNTTSIIVKKNNLYGIISLEDGSILEKIEYSIKDINILLDKINS